MSTSGRSSSRTWRLSSATSVIQLVLTASHVSRVSAVRGVNCDAVIRTLVARGLITEAGTDADSGATTFSTTEMFLERLGLASLGELPDIAPLLPDVDVIDDLSETLDSEPRFARLSATPQAGKPVTFNVDTDV